MPRNTTDITKVLAELSDPSAISFFALADAIYRARFTGPTLIHWANGLPKQVDLGSPVRLSIVQPLDNREDTPP